MALLNKEKSAAAQTSKFEALDDDNVIDGTATVISDDVDTSSAAQTTAAPTAQERLAAAAKEREAEAEAERQAIAATKTSSTTALAAGGKSTALVASKSTALADIFKPMEDAFHVDWNTLESLKANQGQFLSKSDSQSLGPVIGFELLSYQKQFVISPGTEDEEDSVHVRYSDDGITCTSGEDCKEYLQSLLDTGDFPKAKMTERVVLVGCVFDPGTKPAFKDKLMQISLPPTSKALFERFKLQASFNIGRGNWSPDNMSRMRMTCEVQSKNKNDWTQVNFTKYDQ